MGRSVSTPHNAIAVAYTTVEPLDSANYNDSDYMQMLWDDFVISFIDICQAYWPSLQLCDDWIGNEDHIVLENRHAFFGISEYCGLVAVWIVSRGDECRYNGDDSEANLADYWCQQIILKFEEAFGRLRSLGRASNGEQFFTEKHYDILPDYN